MDFSRPSFGKEKHIFVSLDDLCNRRCTYCYLGESSLSRSRPIEREALFRHLQRLYDGHMFRLLTIAGGEPGLVPDLLEVVERVSAIGFKIIINTNGSLGSRRIGEIRRFNILAISFSLDSHDKGVNDRLRFRGSWDLVQNGIRFCGDLGVATRVSAVVCKMNRHHVWNLFEWCNAQNVGVLNIHELDTSVDPEFLDPLKLSPVEWRDLLRDLRSRVQGASYRTALRMPISYVDEIESRSIASDQVACPALSNDSLCVSPDLSVYRCPLLINRQRPSFRNLDEALVTVPLDELALDRDTARCPLSELGGDEGSGLVDACKLVKVTLNEDDGLSNTPVWSDILAYDSENYAGD